MKRTALHVVYLVSALLVLSAFSDSQAAAGTPPFNSFGGGPFDVVNLGNLNVHFTIPIFHKAGRGIPFTQGDLTYDSSIWAPTASTGVLSWTPITGTGIVGAYWGWQGLSSSGASYIYYGVSSSQGVCGMQNNQQYNEYQYGPFTYYDRSGAHSFSAGGVYFDSSACGGYGPPPGFQPPNPQTPVIANDGSGYTLNYTPSFSGQLSMSASITTKSGLTINPPVSSNPSGHQGSYFAIDANGNEITSANGVYTDTLGQTALTVLGTEPSNTTVSYTAPSGAPASYTVSYKSYTVKTNFGCSGVTEYNQSNIYLVDKITLPDTTYYQFAYEATAGGSSGQVTGRLASVTFPTGGNITYQYAQTSSGHNGINCLDGSAPAITGSPSLTRTVSPGGAWTYTRTQGSGNQWQTKVTTPPDPQNAGSAGDDTVIQFQQSSSNFYETQRQAYQGSQSGGALLLTTTTCYNNNLSNCTTTAVSGGVSQTDVTVQYTNGQQALTETKYSATYNLVAAVSQYAYGAGAHGALLLNTQISYATLGSIMDHPGSVVVTDGNGNLISQTIYNYDEYSTYPLQTTTGTPQHTAVTGSRGNVTSIYRYSTTSANLVSHFQYFDTGTVYKSYDVNGAVMTYTYGTTAQGNSTISCGNSFPTSVTLPITSPALSTSAAWNCIGGVATSTTDVNGNSSSVTFSDPFFWRPASTQDAASNTTTFTYTAAGSSTPASIESRMLFNSSNSSISEQLTYLDQLGRPYLSQQEQSPTSTSYDTSETNYDAFGRAYQVTMPYVGTAGQTTTTAPLTATAYDALGRVTQATDGGGGTVSYKYTQNDVLQTLGPAPTGENTKQKQLEYDALGRLTSVCEVTAGTTAWPGGSCGQTNNLTGYLTTYVYDFSSGDNRVTVTQNAQSSTNKQTRVYLYDLLGRLVSETNPENATTTYSFDSASGCTGTFNGDLVKRVDAKSTSTCYAYDALHRVTSAIYSDTTPTKTLVYDAATLNSTAMSNAIGHMAEAYTGASSSKITDEFFSYSVRGELTDTYESTPHSGSTYYHVTAGFWANGGVDSLTSNITGVPSQTYGVDGEGRAYSVTAGSGQNPVTSTSYNLSTYMNTVTFGSLDSDVFTLDPNTGRMTKYKFNVSSKADTGTLTWNANASLKKLVITDTVTGTSDAQTCNYTHDDLARIASANCGSSIWSQTFSYDTFGNIVKNVPTGSAGISFLPTYSETTNQFSLIGSITPTYDADGRLTYDGTHNYTWDAESHMVSVDTTTTTYDALGRMVENNVSGTYTQIVYSPLGKKFASMNGPTLQRAYVPLPGAIAVYTSSGLAYYRHHDHLGSSRLATTPSRTLYSSTAYGPYGEPYAQAGTTDLSFTGQDQDAVSGMHDFQDRKYNPVQGRWLSPDPAGLSAVDPASPQSWNRYAYVNSNPLAMVDPFGDQDACYDPFSSLSAGCGSPSGYGPPGAWTSGGGPSSLMNQGGTPGYVPGTWLNQDQAGILAKVYQAIQANQLQQELQQLGLEVDTSIWVYCDYTSSGGTVTGVGCDPPPEAVDGSQPFMVGDVPLNVDFVHCAECRSLLQNNQSFVGVVAVSGALAGAGGFAAYDISQVEEGALFGTRFAGNEPLLNSLDELRVGWSYVGDDEYVFRIGGDWVPDAINGGHINLWPPSWWLGPP